MEVVCPELFRVLILERFDEFFRSYGWGGVVANIREPNAVLCRNFAWVTL